ncbi:esterase [Aaosphaeria arxii CBS 175.79]|uniref:Esterase n=1 Tax=Aaosphaeria arxii CBS 175.79 TaxID=1450172 RepID=A0A6A5XXU1_9PLEO|nr:esterase [Aaosphaeria arxii CBS 175.79]KAF2017743.1 esterase [Aaosphaeria arxii CBS 175.79]
MSSQGFRLLAFLGFATCEISWQVASIILRHYLGLGTTLPTWPLQRIIRLQITKSILRSISTTRLATPLSLDPGTEGDRFCLLPAASRQLYKGPLRNDDIRPQTIGATWTPERLDPSPGRPPVVVALHFHGGAYVLGNGRDADTGFLAQNYLKWTGCTHVLTPQYRLATTPKGRFPAAAQDALSAYMYLIHNLGIPSEQIIVAGDSAGGNLVMALLRYISEYGTELGIPWPAAALLWSPWTSLASSRDPTSIRKSPNYATDYIHESFPIWGVEGLTGHGGVSFDDPYLSPGLEQSFTSLTPLWVHSGKLELLYEDNRDFVTKFRANGTQVEWDVDEGCPHDIALMGEKLGFEKEAVQASRRAGDFLSNVLSKDKVT